ncbi:hypothetical protein SAMN05421505_14146 [Sinosporangium album]|uniref:Uncharacterized protein n=1 Tax=Sinosporangium album TaxID=504805 RepID=A0A1G8J8P7_9ACTN|nr:hypothetical protein SAMN05421505_14146 [Sinosporangium album]
MAVRSGGSPQPIEAAAELIYAFEDTLPSGGHIRINPIPRSFSLMRPYLGLI